MISPASDDVICSECGEVFANHRGLASHQKKHAKPITCPECDEQVRYLIPHIRAKHSGDGAYDSLLEGLKRLIQENTELKARIDRISE